MEQRQPPWQEAVKVCELAEKGDLKGLEKLADFRNVNLLHNGMTPMMHALLNKTGLHTKSIAILLKVAGVRTDVMSETDETVLHMASRLNNRESAIDVLNNARDFNINRRNSRGDTPLIVAAREGNYNAVKKLLKLNSDVLIVDNEWKTAADWANEWKSHSAMYYDILDHECTQRGMPLFLSGEEGIKRRVELELKVENLCNHAQGGKYKMLQQELTEEISNCRVFTKTPMMFAAEAPGDSGVHCLCELIKKKADAKLSDKYGWTAAHYAAKHNRPNFLSHLGKDYIDLPDNFGMTPLMVAALFGHQNCVSRLIRKSANVDAKDYQNRTARDFAVEKGHRNLYFGC